MGKPVEEKCYVVPGDADPATLRFQFPQTVECLPRRLSRLPQL